MSETKQEQLLALAAVSGELSVAAVERLLPHGEYRRKVVGTLTRQKLLHSYRKDGVRGWRLTKHGKHLLMMQNPARYAALFTGDKHTNAYPSELPRRLRLHRISETLAMMQLGGIRFHLDEKTMLFHSVPVSPPMMPAFYLAKEVQALGDAAIKIRNARMVGLLLAEETYDLVYNTGTSVLRWTPASELRASVLLGEYLGHQLGWLPYRQAEPGALMLGESIELEEKLLTGTGGYHRQGFRLDGTFSRFCYLPNTPQGDAVLWLLTWPDAAAFLNRMLAGVFRPKPALGNFPFDAATDSGAPVLFAWDFDMERIRRFSLGVRERDLHGVVAAFEFQCEVLRRYLGDVAEIRPLSLQKTWEMIRREKL